jgi:hypothetical protein
MAKRRIFFRNKRRSPLRAELAKAIAAKDADRTRGAMEEILRHEATRLIGETLAAQSLVTAQRCVLRWLANEGHVSAEDLPGLQELLRQNHLPGAFGSMEPEPLRALWKSLSVLGEWKKFGEALSSNPDAVAPI